MINDNLYLSLRSIFDPNEEGLVNILEQNQAVVYGSADNPLDTSKPLITYLEQTKILKEKGDKYLEKVSSDPDQFAYFYKSRYWIDTIINFYGESSEDLAIKLMEVLNNNETNFINNDLGIINYSNIQNLTFLENAEFKNRFAISLQIDYNLINRSSEEAYIVKQGEFELNSKQ